MSASHDCDTWLQEARGCQACADWLGKMQDEIVTLTMQLHAAKSALPAATEAARGVSTLLARINALEADNERLREALAYYADEDSYWHVSDGGKCHEMTNTDQGERARQALAHQAVAEENRHASRSELP